MFRLLKSGLPKDPVYPADLEKLGYFINDEDEVRMISNPRAYFNFFLTKNDRYNAVQREAMNTCLRDEVLDRLHSAGLETVRLPLGVEETEPHIPILVSLNISKKKRVVILFYEHTQDLGVFAYRIVGGRGGINAGSAVNFVKYIQSLSGPNGEDPPGVILANIGQLRWWRRGKKAVTHTTWFALPQKSAVSGSYRFDTVENTVANNRSTAEHIEYVFNHVVPDLLAPDAMLDVIAVSMGAVEIVDFLNKPQNWATIQPRLTALALIATYHRIDDISNPWFADWLRKRGRAYLTSSEPASTPLAPPEGNSYTDPDDDTITISDCYGCPVYSLGERYYSELLLPKGYKIVLDWFQEVAAAGEEYENPKVVIPKALREEGGVGEGTKWEEPQNGENGIAETMTSELSGDKIDLEEEKFEDGTAERAEIEQPDIEKDCLSKLSGKDLGYLDCPMETRSKSLTDWGKGGLGEEAGMSDLKRVGIQEQKTKAEEIREERFKETRPKLEGDQPHEPEIMDKKVEEFSPGDPQVENPGRHGNEGEILSDEAAKALLADDIGAKLRKVESNEADMNIEGLRLENGNVDHDLKTEEPPKSYGHTDQGIEANAERGAKRAEAGEAGSSAEDADIERLKTDDLTEEKQTEEPNAAEPTNGTQSNYEKTQGAGRSNEDIPSGIAASEDLEETSSTVSLSPSTVYAE